MEVEVVNITPKSLWLHVKGKEYSLSYEDFPWFKNAAHSQIREVKLRHNHYLHWAKLDVDLELESLENLGKYCLKYR